jgi:hypothetical protein
VGDLWSELSKQLADRWLSALVLPGVLYLAVAAAAHTLGDRHPFDVALLARTITAQAENPAVTGTAGQILLLVAVVVAAAAAGVAAQGAGAFVERAVLAAGWTTGRIRRPARRPRAAGRGSPPNGPNVPPGPVIVSRRPCCDLTAITGLTWR